LQLQDAFEGDWACTTRYGTAGSNQARLKGAKEHADDLGELEARDTWQITGIRRQRADQLAALPVICEITGGSA